MRNLYCLVLVLFVSIPCMGQSDGDYRSRQSGNWNTVTTWEVFNALAWHNLEDPGAGVFEDVIPSSASGIITMMTGTTVTIPNGQSITADQIEFENIPFSGSTGALSVEDGGTLIVNNGAGDDIRLLNDFTTFALLEVAGTLQLNTGATIVDDDYQNLFIGASPVSSITYKILDGGTHIHTTGVGVADIPAADWQSGSTCQVNATSGTVPTIDASIIFHHFVWNGAAQGTALSMRGELLNVNGDFVVSATNNQFLQLTTTLAYNLAIGRDFLIQGNSRVQLSSTASVAVDVGRNFEISSTNTSAPFAVSFNATGNPVTVSVTGDFLKSNNSLLNLCLSTGTTVLNLLGNFSHTGGTITKSAGTATINFNGAFTTSTFTNTATMSGAINYVIAASKTLNLGTSPMTGNGSFTLNGIIGLGSVDANGALQSSTTAGNIRTTVGSRTFATGSTIVYNGASAQFIGNGFPSGSDVNLTIDNPSGVTLSTSLDIVALRVLSLASGNISIGAQTLTINGTLSGAGGVVGGPTSNMNIGGTGNFGTLTFSGTNQLLNFTLSRTSSGLVTLGGDLAILGTFTQNAGDLAVGNNVFTVSGNFSRTGGNLSVTSGSTLAVDGEGTLPAEVGLSGTAIGTLTLDRADAVFTTNASIEITNLNLISGLLDNGTGISIADGGTITRHENGEMSNSPSNTVNDYNVVYDISDLTTSGPELVTNVLNNLTKTGSSSLTLANGVTVNGTLMLSGGNFNASTFAVTLRGNFVSNASGNFETSALTFGGTTTISGGTAPNFNNFTVSMGSTLNLGTLTTVNVSGNITNNGTISGGTSTIVFDGSTTLDGGGTTIVKGSFHNITIAGSGTFTPACALCVPVNSYRIDVSGNFTVLTGGTFSEGQGAVRLNGSAPQSLTMDGENFYNLEVFVSNTTVTLAEALLVSNNLTISEPATLDVGPGNQEVFVGGNLTINGTFVPNFGRVTLDGSATQSIGKTSGTTTINFYNLRLNKPASTIFNVTTPINIMRGVSFVQSGGGYTVNFGGTVASPNVTLLADQANGRTGHILSIPDGLTISGNVRVQRYMEPGPSGDQIYRYISSPINGNPVSQLQDDFPVTGPFTGASSDCPDFGNRRNMYIYDETVAGTSENGYVGFPTANVTQAMTSGRGYAVQMCDGESIITWDVSGSIRRATTAAPVSLPVTYANNGLPNDDGLNLVGNPFPAPLDWEASGWVKTNITNTFWIRNNKELNIASYNGDLDESTNGATQYIAMGQAFWVQATASSPLLTITESVKQDQQPEFFRKDPLPDLLRLTVNRDGISDEIIVHFDERADDASNTFGDSRKFRNEFMNLFSFAEDSVRLAINSMQTWTCARTVGLGLNDVEPGTYSFSYSGFESFQEDVTITLVDLWKGLTHELTPEGTYAFEVTDDAASHGTSRFRLVFSQGESVRAVNAVAEPVCEDNVTHMVIEDPQPGIKYYAVNASGEVISKTITATGTDQLILDVTLPAGENQVTLMGNKEGCAVIPVATLSAISVLAKPSITEFENAFTCGPGTATLVVTGAEGTAAFNWYASADDIEPLATTSTGEWITPAVDQAIEYYVSASNVLGCEGERVAVSVEVRNVEQPELAVSDGKLVTQATGTLTWFLEGEKIQDGGTSIELTSTGEYSVTSDLNGCLSTTFRYVSAEELSDATRIKVSPNPAADFVTIEVFSAASGVNVTFTGSNGQEIDTFELNKNGTERFSGTIDLAGMHAGLYILRITEDNQVTYKRLIRK